MNRTLVLGKIDYNRSGRKNCKATLEWELKDGRFSMSASVWNPRETDINMGGQCVDEVVSYFPGNAKAQRMMEVWKAWHLNDMKAGSPAQEAFLHAHPVTDKLNHYQATSDALMLAGLNPDPNYLHPYSVKRDGVMTEELRPYKYGSAWLTVELPAEVVAEIESW